MNQIYYDNNKVQNYSRDLKYIAIETNFLFDLKLALI